MKKFEFPLARVASWYQQELSLEQLALQNLQTQLLELDQQVQAIHLRKAAEQERMLGAATLNGYELQSLAGYTTHLLAEIDRLRPLRARLTKRIEEQKARVVVRHRKVRLMENLEQKRREEWRQALGKEEDALASELHLARIAREAQTADISAS